MVIAILEKIEESTLKYINKCNIKRSDMDNYEIIGSYTGSGNKIDIFHKKCNRIFSMRATNFLNDKRNCNLCYGRSGPAYTLETFSDACKKRRKDKMADFEILSFSGYEEKGEIYHKICNRVFMKNRMGDFLGQNDGCSLCSKNRPYTKQTFIEACNLKRSDMDEFEIIGEYINIETNIDIFHNKCKRDFKMRPGNFLFYEYKCPLCSSEKNESWAVLEIKEYLLSNSILFQTEVWFDDLRIIRPLKIDFFLPEYNIYIEYDGEQHFHYRENGIFTESKFNDIVISDNMKNEYFKKKGLNLIRINYKEDHIKRLKGIISSTTIKREG